MSLPDWQLPKGVSRSLWEFAHDPRIPRDEERHLADSPLLAFDRQTVARWFPVPGALLDLGCGTGRLTIDFARRGWSAVGVDLSAESLRVAKEQAEVAGVSISLLRANLCELNCLSPEHFDAALLMFGTLGMISGSTNRAEVLRHAHRLLKPGAGLALHVHNVWRHLFFEQGRHWLLRDIWRRLTRNPAAGDTSHGYRGIPQMYHHSFTLRELRKLLRDTGFETVEIIPLAPDADLSAEDTGRSVDRTESNGWLRDLQATGWLLLARRHADSPPPRFLFTGRDSEADDDDAYNAVNMTARW
jgi:ubiquinone/menaquinone biosynthesis C-methylase UbiE